MDHKLRIAAARSKKGIRKLYWIALTSFYLSVLHITNTKKRKHASSEGFLQNQALSGIAWKSRLGPHPPLRILKKRAIPARYENDMPFPIDSNVLIDVHKATGRQSDTLTALWTHGRALTSDRPGTH